MLAERGGQFVEPGARYALLLQAVQNVQGAVGGVDLFQERVIGAVQAYPRAEIHQAAAEAKEHGGQGGGGYRQGFGVRHRDVPEIPCKRIDGR